MHALRQLAKTPGFTVVALLTLALGVGVNTTVYSIARDLFLRPLLRDREARLASLFICPEASPTGYRPFSTSEFTALRADRAVFADVAAFRFSEVVLGVPGDVRSRLIALASENYFSVLGVSPARGRFFTAEEARPGAAPVLVASHALWQRLGSRADFLGSQVLINQCAHTVIGIAPAGFGGLHSAIGPDLWLPLGAFDPAGAGSAPVDSPRFHLVANLAPGLTLERAHGLLPALAATLNAPPLGDPARPSQLALMPPSRFSLSAHAPQDESFIGQYATLSFCLSLAVLLVACLNLANMLLARGASRRKEIALRFALGASRWQVMRPLLAEGLILGLAGGGLGLMLSLWPGEFMQLFNVELSASGSFAFTEYAMLDRSIVFLAFALGALAMLAFSVVPALRATRINLVDDLKLQPGAFAESGRWNRFFSFRHCLVMAQIAVSLLILFSAGLFLRSAHAATQQDPGFNPAGQLVARLDFRFLKLSPTEQTARQLAVLDRFASVPGVAHAAFASTIPFNFEANTRRIQLPGTPAGSTPSDPTAYLTAVTSGYFRQLGIPLRGRDFTPAEAAQPSSPPVAIIDESLARLLFADADPLGRRIVDPGTRTEMEIVGLVRSPREDVFHAEPPRRFYRPLAQEYHSGLYLHLAAADPSATAALLDSVRRELRQLDPAIPVLRLAPLADIVGRNLNLWTLRLAAYIFLTFGLIALLLALVGIYAVKSYVVARRTREIGIRLALGAQRADVVTLILRQGALQAAFAIAVGTLLSLLAGQMLAKLLFHVAPFEFLILAACATVVALAALLAAWLPARRATRVSPLEALRTE
ncbi:MAG: ADOP family duplicated permease [Verrucomicrobiota bacterium]